MSSPRAIIQILLTGSAIFGRALAAAGKQAVKNAQHRPQDGFRGDIAGVGNATSGSVTDRLTRDHRMTLDEAHLILNLKRGDGATIESVLQRYEHLFKANSPPPPPATPPTARTPLQAHSYYLQSKVVRARERIEAEMQAGTEPTEPPPPSGTQPPPSSTPHPPPTS